MCVSLSLSLICHSQIVDFYFYVCDTHFLFGHTQTHTHREIMIAITWKSIPCKHLIFINIAHFLQCLLHYFVCAIFIIVMFLDRESSKSATKLLATLKWPTNRRRNMLELTTTPIICIIHNSYLWNISAQFDKKPPPIRVLSKRKTRFVYEVWAIDKNIESISLSNHRIVFATFMDCIHFVMFIVDLSIRNLNRRKKMMCSLIEQCNEENNK